MSKQVKVYTMEAVIIHAQREEEANEWKKELEAKYPHVTIRTGYFGAVIVRT